MKKIKKIEYKLSFLSIVIILLFAVHSCTDNDRPYEQYIDDTVIEYAGKVDSLKALFGIKKAKLTWKLSADPGVKYLKIFSTDSRNEKDSIQIPIEASEIGMDMEYVLDDLNPGSYTFTVVTYNNEEEKSIPVEAFTTILDENYTDRLRANPVLETTINDGDLEIVWKTNLNLDYVGSEITYTNTDDEVVNKTVEQEDEETILEDYKEGSTVHYYSKYYPENALEIFVSETIVLPVKFVYPQSTKDSWVITADARPGDARRPSNFIDGLFNGQGEYVAYSADGSGHPHFFDLKFNETLTISGAEIIQRAAYNFGVVKDIEFLYSSDNGVTWISIIETELPYAAVPANRVTVNFDADVQATDFRVIFISENRGSSLVAVGELNLFKIIK